MLCNLDVQWDISSIYSPVGAWLAMENFPRPRYLLGFNRKINEDGPEVQVKTFFRPILWFCICLSRATEMDI